MSTIGGRRLDLDHPGTMGGKALGPDAVDTTHLGTLTTVVPRKPSAEERERRAELERLAAEELRQERLAFAAAQPKAVVLAAELEEVRLPAYGLAEALARLEDVGGTVTANDDGTLTFVIPALTHPRPASHTVFRHQALEAVKALDAARPVVHRCVRNDEPLPDARPAAGGGAAA